MFVFRANRKLLIIFLPSSKTVQLLKEKEDIRKGIPQVRVQVQVINP